MDMFPSSRVRRHLAFEKYQIFHPTRGFSANNFTSTSATLFFFKNLKTIDSLTHVSNFLFREVNLILLFKFKIGPR